MNTKSLISQDSELKTALLQRGENVSEVGLRDLKRYYALLNHDLLELALTPDEARLICEVLKDYRFEDDPAQARMIWQQIDKKLQSQPLDPQGIVNGAKHENLIRKLQALTHLGSVALVDAVERYWARERTNPGEPLQTRLLRVDLIKCCDFAV
jgi:hypothetical protein